MKTIKQKEKETFEALKKDFGYTNVMQAPRLLKITIASGVGSFKDKKKIDVVKDRLAKIVGQKVAIRGAKKSIASFKTRVGDIIGTVVTLRAARMQSFLDKLIHVALPRTKDFRGLPVSAIDEMGNMSIGIREHTIFPESSDEELKDVFGIGVTLVTTARTKKEAEAFFRYLGFPFKKPGADEPKSKERAAKSKKEKK